VSDFFQMAAMFKILASLKKTATMFVYTADEYPTKRQWKSELDLFDETRFGNSEMEGFVTQATAKNVTVSPIAVDPSGDIASAVCSHSFALPASN
jgi:hypothetical protein